MVLSRLTTAVEKSKALPTSVRKTLAAQLATETSGISGLAASVEHEPAGTLAAAATAMVQRYRVYVVTVPKVRIALRAARQQHLEQRAVHFEGAVSARIAAAQKAGRTVAAAQRAYQDLVTQLATATSATSSASTVVSVQPSDYPADASSIAAARKDLESARSVVPAVRSDVRAIRSSLRSA